MDIDGTTFFSSKLLPRICAGPQKQKHKVVHVYFTFYKVRGLFLVIKTRAIILSNTILKIDIFGGQKVKVFEILGHQDTQFLILNFNFWSKLFILSF
jgi:hypothetical protein